MPLIWVRHYTGESGKPARIITSTMGSAVDLENPGLRRLFVNACYWGLGMTPETAGGVDYIGEYKPSWFGYGKFVKGIKPEDLGVK
jgi:hypothetical protein